MSKNGHGKLLDLRSLWRPDFHHWATNPKTCICTQLSASKENEEAFIVSDPLLCSALYFLHR